MVHGQYINIQVHTHAKADVVYALLRDGASWPTWTSIDSFELERGGLPVRDYRADVDLEPNAEGTRIRWHVSFSPKVPGAQPDNFRMPSEASRPPTEAHSMACSKKEEGLSSSMRTSPQKVNLV